MKIFLLSILFVCAFAQEDPRDPDWDNLVKVSPERGCLNLCSRWYGSSRRPGKLVVGKRSRCIIACTSSERIRYQKSAVCDRYCTEMCRGTGCRGKCHFRCRVPANTMRTRIISLRRNSDGNIRVEIPRGLRQGVQPGWKAAFVSRTGLLHAIIELENPRERSVRGVVKGVSFDQVRSWRTNVVLFPPIWRQHGGIRTSRKVEEEPKDKCIFLCKRVNSNGRGRYCDEVCGTPSSAWTRAARCSKTCIESCTVSESGRKRCKKENCRYRCKHAKLEPVFGRVTRVKMNRRTRTEITINRGTASRVEPDWQGALLRKSGSILERFSLDKLEDRYSIATLGATSLDGVQHSSKRVVLVPPKWRGGSLEKGARTFQKQIREESERNGERMDRPGSLI